MDTKLYAFQNRVFGVKFCQPRKTHQHVREKTKMNFYLVPFHPPYKTCSSHQQAYSHVKTRTSAPVLVVPDTLPFAKQKTQAY